MRNYIQCMCNNRTCAKALWRLYIAIALCLSHCAHAQDLSNLTWHGFISQGYVYTTDNNFFGPSEDGGSWEFTDVGLGATWKPYKRIQLSAQTIYQKSGNASPNGFNLDYGLVDVKLFNKNTSGLGLRLGRIKNPYGFHNETRDIPATPRLRLSSRVDLHRRSAHTVPLL